MKKVWVLLVVLLSVQIAPVYAQDIFELETVEAAADLFVRDSFRIDPVS